VSNVYREPAWALLTPAQITELANSLDNTSAVDLNTTRYQAHFQRQGLSDAEARSRAEFWAKLKTTMPEGSVIDPDPTVDDILMQRRLQNGAVDPSSITAATPTGIRVSAAATYSSAGPPSAVEPPPSYFFPIDQRHHR
jgi:hypothetical protein